MSESTRPDIEQARGRMHTKFGGKREFQKLDEHLWPNESVREMTTGFYGSGLGLVVLTDRRLIFVREGRMSQTFEDFPLDKVSSVQWKAGMLQGLITVFASANKAEIKQVDKSDGKRLSDLLRAEISGIDRGAPAVNLAPAAPLPPTASVTPPPPPPAIPAGWYPSPNGIGQTYWDGSAWTEHTAP